MGCKSECIREYLNKIVCRIIEKCIILNKFYDSHQTNLATAKIKFVSNSFSRCHLLSWVFFISPVLFTKVNLFFRTDSSLSFFLKVRVKYRSQHQTCNHLSVSRFFDYFLFFFLLLKYLMFTLTTFWMGLEGRQSNFMLKQISIILTYSSDSSGLFG